MPLFATTVVVPYRLERTVEAPIYSVQIEAVASSEQAALATAHALSRFHCRLQHGRDPAEVLLDRAQVGSPDHKVIGPYCYIFTRSDRIVHIDFPRRIGDSVAEDLDASLAGLDMQLIHGAIMDCAQMSYINTRGLSALVANGQRANLHFFRISEPLQKVMAIVGIHKHLSIHPDISGAMGSLQARAKRDRTGLAAGGFLRRN